MCATTLSYMTLPEGTDTFHKTSVLFAPQGSIMVRLQVLGGGHYERTENSVAYQHT